jgi:hypothetical protein
MNEAGRLGLAIGERAIQRLYGQRASRWGAKAQPTTLREKPSRMTSPLLGGSTQGLVARIVL